VLGAVLAEHDPTERRRRAAIILAHRAKYEAKFDWASLRSSGWTAAEAIPTGGALTVGCRICHFWIVFSLRRLVARSQPTLAWVATPSPADHIRHDVHEPHRSDSG
jgi:hypothetical protein